MKELVKLTKLTQEDYAKIIIRDTFKDLVSAGMIGILDKGAKTDDVPAITYCYKANKDDWDMYALSEDIMDWSAGSKIKESAFTFGGLYIAQGPLAYENDTYVIKDSWNHDSYESKYGKNNGSYYFTFIEMGKLFEKDNFTGADGSIENLLDPLNGWRLPSKDEWISIVGTTREGSTVNRVANKHYALIQLTGVTHAGSDTPNGLLIFPDGCTIAGKELSGMDDTTQTTGVTGDELSAYLEQGCVFLPASGFYAGGAYSSGGDYGYYWSSTDDDDDACLLNFNASSINSASHMVKSNIYNSVRLVKSPSTGEQVQSDWTEEDRSSPAYIKNKPFTSLPVASANTLGGVKVGNNLSIDPETSELSVTQNVFEIATSQELENATRAEMAAHLGITEQDLISLFHAPVGTILKIRHSNNYMVSMSLNVRYVPADESVSNVWELYFGFDSGSLRGGVGYSACLHSESFPENDNNEFSFYFVEV